MPDGTGALDVRDLTVTYGPIAAVDQVSLQVAPGAVVGLIGPNGAGKTTCIDAVTGFTPATGGTVRLGGRPLDGLAAHRRARAGLARTFQTLDLFEDLTVRENLLVAATPGRWWHPLVDAVRPGRAHDAGRVDRVLDRTGLAGHAHRLPGELSHGHRNVLGLARALVAGPRMLLLDEPAAGLDPAETTAVGDLIRDVADEGRGVLLVDHDMGLVMRVCDTVTVLDFGRVIAQGTPDEVRRDPTVVAAYLGTGS